MLRHHALFLGALLVAGCQAEDQARLGSHGQRPNVDDVTSGATFEVRDFRLERNAGTSADWTSWSGRGNLVTKAPEAQNTTILVFLEYRDTKNPSVKPTQMSVVVRDGIGLVETYDLVAEAPQYEWVINGWIPLNPASLTTTPGSAKR